VAVSTSAVKIVSARPGRKKLLVYTEDSNMYFGDSSVTTSNGFARLGSDNYNLEIEFDGEMWAVMASGSGTCSIMEVF
jgi:hypothetical protein